MNQTRLATALIILASLTIASCASTSLDVIRHDRTHRIIHDLRLGSITLESLYSYSPDKTELKSLIISMAAKCDITITEREEDTSDNDYTIRLMLREKNYVKGFETVVSTAVLADVLTPDGNILYQVAFTRDGKDSLTSLGYTREALLEVFKALRKAMPRK